MIKSINEVGSEMASDFSSENLNDMIEALAKRARWATKCGCSPEIVSVFVEAHNALLALNSLAGGEFPWKDNNIAE